MYAFPFVFPPIMYHSYENIILWDPEHIFWTRNNTYTSLLNMLRVHLEIYWPIYHSNMYMTHSFQVWLTFLKLSPAVPARLCTFFLFSLFIIRSNLKFPSSWNVQGTYMSEKIHYQDLHIRRLHHSYLLQSIQQVYVLLLNFCYFLMFLNFYRTAFNFVFVPKVRCLYWTGLYIVVRGCL